MKAQYRRLRYACYSINVTMSATSCLSPVLFLTFRSLYGISFSLLGFLVLVNFFTQLLVDLALSFFSHRMDLAKTVKRIPLLALVGFGVYALLPMLFPDFAFLGLRVGTVIFSFSAGLAEVLISPVIAAIPAPDPDREMSKLHSVYAWGCVAVVIIGAAYLVLFGGENWYFLPLIFALIPALSAALFWGTEIPEMEKPGRVMGAVKLLCDRKVLLSVFCIFLGGASECTMAQWCSGYLEQAMGIPKLWGDLFGTALFSVALGMGRSLYAKYGRQIHKILLACFGSTALCYLTAAISPVPLIGLVACALTGFCASMLWPGNLVVAADRNPSAGVFIYAIMAAGGDLGASVGPQLMGIVADVTAQSGRAAELCQSVSISPESLGMKAGMLVGMLFPVIGLILTLFLKKGERDEAVR
ncbi:MAG: MFS transporter [Clostridia bacterium]|nr:MFS transporter [Clostridia bacterium]